MIYLDMAIFLACWVVAQILFNGYEAHVPFSKRIAKLGVLLIIFAGIRYFLGRRFFYGIFGLMTIGIGVLHGYWFHLHHGIHWRTAQPRDKYLQIISTKTKPS